MTTNVLINCLIDTVHFQRLELTKAVLNKLGKNHSCRFGIIQGDFLFFFCIRNGTLCGLIKHTSMRRF